MQIVVSYFVYLVISITLTVWVARALRKRGAIFLANAFHGNVELADSVNHLLVVGFYLINIGFVSLALKSDLAIDSWRRAAEMLSAKIGWVLVTLGAMHFFILFVLSRNPDKIANELGRITLDARQPEGTVSDYLR